MKGLRLFFAEKGEPLKGHFIFYHEDGSKEREGDCLNGKPEGALKLYNEKGNVAYLVNFKDGLPNGPATRYNNDGKVTNTEMYRKGKFIKEIK